MNQEIKQIVMSRYNQLPQKGRDCIKTIVFFCLTRELWHNRIRLLLVSRLIFDIYYSLHVDNLHGTVCMPLGKCLKAETLVLLWTLGFCCFL